MGQRVRHFQQRGFLSRAMTISRSAGIGELSAWLLQSGSPAPELLVYAHGTGNDAFYPQLSLFTVLLEAGIDVLTFDLDGHGAQSRSLFNGDQILCCLPEVLATVTGDYDGLHLAGHSLGGALVAHYLATTGTTQPLSASLVSAPVSLPPVAKDLIRELRSVFLKSARRQLSVYGLRDIWPAIGPFRRQTFPMRLACPEKGGYMTQVTGFINSLDLLALAGNIQVPLLLCYGEKDAVVPPEQGRALADVVKDSRLYVLPSETHFTCLLAEDSERLILWWILNWQKQKRQTK